MKNYIRLEMIIISKNNNKNINKKDLSEKKIEKVSGGCCDPRGCNPENYKHPWKRKPDFKPTLRYGGVCKLDFDKIKEKINSNPENIKSLLDLSKDSDKIK